jgi:hypothetical protein
LIRNRSQPKPPERTVAHIHAGIVENQPIERVARRKLGIRRTTT